MAISALIRNVSDTLTAWLVPTVELTKLTNPQALRLYRRLRLAAKLTSAWQSKVADELKRRVNLGQDVKDVSGTASITVAVYKTYNVDDAVRVLTENGVALASVLKVTNKALESLPAEIIAQIGVVSEPTERVKVTGEAMDER